MSILSKNFKVGAEVRISGTGSVLDGFAGFILGKGIQGVIDMYIVCTKHISVQKGIPDHAVLLPEGHLELVEGQRDEQN